ncbi:MAG TPA: NAD-dependent epimerase/dehydratase family protein [Actinomycetota bacterium]|nr:NAD-dependent epimerase/dehydratase family protein [Actinomycetota bacterium]
MDAQTILVTGGAGFLGSHFVRAWLAETAGHLVNLDLLTYAGNAERLDDLAGDERYRFVHGDVADRDLVRATLRDSAPELVVHFAAESHVTRSELDPGRFHRTNVDGTLVMLEEAAAANVRRFVHISTDEVYGPILDGAFREEDKEPGEGRATSPYARSKALADDVATGFDADMGVVVVRPTNAFGPWQFPEKAFPRWITRAVRGEPLLVWGDGLYVRQWLYAEDLSHALALILGAAAPEPVYNVGPRHEPEITNLDLARWLVEHLGLPEDRLRLTEYDRPDHDRRYAVDPARIEGLGWKPSDPWERFAETVAWYRANDAWWRPLVAEAESIYRDAR